MRRESGKTKERFLHVQYPAHAGLHMIGEAADVIIASRPRRGERNHGGTDGECKDGEANNETDGLHHEDKCKP